MRCEEWTALGVQTYGMSEDLVVPIAARDIETIEKYVGRVVRVLPGRSRPVNAVLVEAARPQRLTRVPLWAESRADEFYRRLHPFRQLWVHVDYRGYRAAWHRLGLDQLDRSTVLDHIHNRHQTRMEGYVHPFLRLCPVSRSTNTSGGLNRGFEGMAKKEVGERHLRSEALNAATECALAAPVVLADPIDMTKMLDIPPGIDVLPGAARMLMKFYRT